MPPIGKKCIEPGCTRGAFPWDERCPRCEKKHRKALRAANAKPISARETAARDGGTYTTLVTRGGR